MSEFDLKLQSQERPRPWHHEIAPTPCPVTFAARVMPAQLRQRMQAAEGELSRLLDDGTALVTVQLYGFTGFNVVLLVGCDGK